MNIAKVVVGRVSITQRDGLFPEPTPEPYLTVWLKIQNKEAAGEVVYTGWMNAAAAKTKIKATLTDEQGRPFALVPITKDDFVSGAKSAATLTGGSGPISDALLFIPPKEPVQYLQLTLSGEAFAQKGDLHFQIPWSMVKTEDSNPLVGGASPAP